MIEIEELRKSYDDVKALDGFSLRVEQGELFGLVGPNGAGKTTLIKILATLVPSDSGQARIAGHDVVREPRAIRPLIGYLPDVPGLYQDMRVREFLEFFADAFRLPRERKRIAIERALERAGLADRRAAFVEELSLGLKQRLLLAKTLLHEPRVLLLDEPATGLDPLARIELREQLKALNREDVTIFISSHILSDLEDICTRVALIATGRNVADSEGHSVLTLRVVETPRLLCDIDIVGDAEVAARALANFAGCHLLEAVGSRLHVEITGGSDRAAALLKHLVGIGVSVLRFDSHSPGLEERYRKTFGGEKP